MMSSAQGPGCLVIRADAGPVMGTGHVLRSLALAAAWQARGGEVVLASHALPEVLRQRVKEAGVAVRDPGGRHPAPADLEGTLNIVRELNAAALVLDGYFLDPDYQRTASAATCPTLVLDDHHHQASYHADLLLNQNHGASAAHYAGLPADNLLLGADYTMLRPEFLAVKPRTRTGAPRRAFRLLVTLGGSDVGALVPRLLQALDPTDLDLTVAAGHSTSNLTALRNWAVVSDLHLRIVAAAEDMPRLMDRADLALSGAGTTAWELAYLGVPMLLLELADNQRPIGTALAEHGAAVALGPARGCNAWHVASMVEALRGTPDRLAAMSAKGRELVDGRGALRVVDALLKARSRCGEGVPA